MKVIIAPGNGCTNILRSNWYGQLHSDLKASGIESICETFPDPNEAKRSIWLPHIESLGANEETILVGHSSGAQAALRYAESHKLKAVILVAATYTDLGDAGERASGYYPDADGKNEYKFSEMRANCGIWHQFHSDDDPFIPLAEAEQIRHGLGLNDDEYHMLPGRSHFFEPFSELLETIKSIT
mmetsp:Transcript_28703/g.54192  ORF Transcript_28703/g.54192 Transcript_28703/m.54192 type:complete len:184 (-) Transcript_28703:21-572(-)